MDFKEIGVIIPVSVTALSAAQLKSYVIDQSSCSISVDLVSTRQPYMEPVQFNKCLTPPFEIAWTISWNFVPGV